MTRLLVLCCFSFLLAGVFGADFTVSLMKGDDVTLPINAAEIRGNERLQWKFNGKDIATIDLEVINSQLNYLDERFTNRLNLDRTTGSLNINKITTEDTGEYQLEIKYIRDKNYKTLKTFSVTVTDQAFTVSVVKGGSFSLPTGDKIQPDDVKEWKFNGTVLTNGRFPNTNINPQTGELKITNIKPDQSGEYEVKIDGSLILHRTFRVNINDEVKSVSGVEGGSITLNIDTETEADDVIEWKFENTPIAKVNNTVHLNSEYVLDKRFRGRLHVDWDGSLIILNFKTGDFGLYDVKITNINRFIYKTFSVTGADFTVSVMKGDDVTLPVNAGKIRGDERLQWKFKNKIIANIDLEVKTSKLNYIDERFTHRLNLNRKTGSLNISHIRTEDTGEYQLEIRSIIDKDFKTLKTFSVTVTESGLSSGVIAGLCVFFLLVIAAVIAAGLILYRRKISKLKHEVKLMSVVEGESVTLHTYIELQKDTVVEWMYENDKFIAKIEDKKITIDDEVLDGRFREVLKLDHETGSLTITKFKPEHAGLYEVKITRSKGTSISKFNVYLKGITKNEEEE